MLYLILQTTALFFGIYFIGTFIGCLLHKFFHMLFGSKDTMAIAGASAMAGAAGATSSDLKLFTHGKNAKVAKTIEEQNYVPGQRVGSPLPSDAAMKGSTVASYSKTVHLETIEQLPTHDSKTLKKRGLLGKAFGGPTEKIVTKQTKQQIGQAVDSSVESTPKSADKVSVPTVAAAVTAATAAIATAVQDDDPKVEAKAATPPAPIVTKDSTTKVRPSVTGSVTDQEKTLKTAATKGTTDIKTTTVNKIPSTQVNKTRTPKKKGFWSKWFGNPVERTDGISPSTGTKTVSHDVEKKSKPKISIPMADTKQDSGKKLASKITVPAVGAVTAAAATIATSLKDDGQALAGTIKDKIPEIADVKDVLSDVKAAVTPDTQKPALEKSKTDSLQTKVPQSEKTPDIEAVVEEIKADSPQEAKTEAPLADLPSEPVTSDAANTPLAGAVQAMPDEIIPITEVEDKIIKVVKDVAGNVIDKKS